MSRWDPKSWVLEVVSNQSLCGTSFLSMLVKHAGMFINAIDSPANSGAPSTQPARFTAPPRPHFPVQSAPTNLNHSDPIRSNPITSDPARLHPNNPDETATPLWYQLCPEPDGRRESRPSVLHSVGPALATGVQQRRRMSGGCSRPAAVRWLTTRPDRADRIRGKMDGDSSGRRTHPSALPEQRKWPERRATGALEMLG